VAAGHLDHEVAQAPWMVSEAGDDPRAAGRALLMQVINAGDADVGSGGGVDARGRRLHQRQPCRVAPQQHQTHRGLVYLDLEPKHLTQERGGGRKIGGQVIMTPSDSPIGRMAVVTGNQGETFGIIALAPAT
jgi:hypothetical protein